MKLEVRKEDDNYYVIDNKKIEFQRLDFGYEVNYEAEYPWMPTYALGESVKLANGDIVLQRPLLIIRGLDRVSYDKERFSEEEAVQRVAKIIGKLKEDEFLFEYEK